MRARPRRRSPVPPPAGGFTFLGLLFLIALMGLMASVAATTWTFTVQRDKELDLLFVGHEYRVALTRYAAAHARQAQPFPTDLRQLLGDDQLISVRYLRRPYFDPMTGGADWGLVRTPQGGITAVYSLSSRAPVRRQPPTFDDGIDFRSALSYRDWVFHARMPASTPGNATGGGDNGGDPPIPSWDNPPPTPPTGVVERE